MARLRCAASAALIATTGIALAACSGSLSPTALGMMHAPKLPELPKLTFEDDPVVGSPIDVYSAIARGAMTCWFGAGGPLKGRYIYHGDAKPPSAGGQADIVIHAIDTTSPSPRGLRTFHISIKADGDKTLLAVENLKMPEVFAKQMTDDVHRWAAGETGCGEAEAQAGWTPRPEAAASAKPATISKRK